MGDRPNGFVVRHPGGQPAKDDLQMRPLLADSGVRELVEKATHGAVALGGAVAARDAGTLVPPGTHAHPRGELRGGREGGGLRADFRDDLLGGVHAEPGHLREAGDRRGVLL
jgi:hypothetical protein